MTRHVRYCSDFDGPCCPTCHHDFDEGYDEPMEFDMPDGSRALVCCEKYGLVKQAGGEYATFEAGDSEDG